MAEGLVNYTRLDDPEEIIVTTQGRPISADDEMRVVDEDGLDVPRARRASCSPAGPYTIRGYYKAEEHNAPDLHRRRLLPHRRPGAAHPRGLPGGRGPREGSDQPRAARRSRPRRWRTTCSPIPPCTTWRSSPSPTRSSASARCAFVIPARSAVPPRSALTAFLRERGLAAYKVPDRIEFVAAFPQTGVGKVSKKDLRRSLAP